MKFTPVTADDIKKKELLTGDTATFEVLKASESTSKAGNPMLVFTLKLWDKEGKEVIHSDYFLDNTRMSFKLRHFCEITSLLEHYTKGEVPPYLCVGKSGLCKIGIRKDEKYGDQNVIVDYLPNPNASSNMDSQEDIPF